MDRASSNFASSPFCGQEKGDLMQPKTRLWEDVNSVSGFLGKKSSFLLGFLQIHPSLDYAENLLFGRAGAAQLLAPAHPAWLQAWRGGKQRMLSLTTAGRQEDSIRTGATSPRSNNIYWRKNTFCCKSGLVA